MLKRILAAALALLMTAAALPAAVPAEAEGETFTLLMYMCGTDLSEACEADLYEMSDVWLPSGVTVLVQVGGSWSWADEDLVPGGSCRFRVGYREWYDFTEISRANMGKPETLRDFILWGMETAPADRYGVVLWDHGGGTLTGVCCDDVFGGDTLTLPELDEAFSAVQEARPGTRFDFIGFDACLMATYETALTMMPYADYMIASEELASAVGLSYNRFLPELASAPAGSAQVLLAHAAETYVTSTLALIPDDCLTLSVLDLRIMGELNTHMEAVGRAMYGALQKEGGYADIARLRSTMYGLGDFYDPEGGLTGLVDLDLFLQLFSHYAPNACAAAREALHRVVVHSSVAGDLSYISGMSVLLPRPEDLVGESGWRSDYDRIPRNEAFGEFTVAYTELSAGREYQFSAAAEPETVSVSEEGWNDLTTSLEAAGEDEAAVFSALGAPQTGFDPDNSYGYSLALTDEDMMNLSYAEGCLVLQYVDSSYPDETSLVNMGLLQDTWIDWPNSRVYSMFDGTWPVMGGQFVAMYDQVRTERTRRSLIHAKVNGADSYLVVLFEGASREGRVIGVSTGTGEGSLPSRSLAPLEPGSVVVPLFDYTYISADGEEIEDLLEGDPITVPEAGLTVDYEQLAGDGDEETSLWFCFCLNDIYGGWSMSDSVMFE